MADPQQLLAQQVSAAVTAAFGTEFSGTDPVIRPSQFADYQANVALPLAKRLGRPPREVAAAIAAGLDLAGICEAPEVSGPGFINLRLREDWLAGQAGALGTDDRLGVPLAAGPRTVVVEYSSPNLAKEMHPGHLRTTIVGDALARILEATGHQVIRDNHVGDWGTQFGMLIEHLLDVGEHSAEAGLLRTDPNTFYAAARRKFDTDPEFTARARGRLVQLQAGDPDTLRIWRELTVLSEQYLADCYARLRVSLTPDDIRGESFYNDLLPGVAADLEASGQARISDGALCAFPAGFTGREGDPLPVIVRKSDGGWNYSTTDLATVRYRVDKLNADQAIYVVGSDQALHFQMVFAVAREAGWIPASASFQHSQIGMVTGPGGGKLRTREGDTPKLTALLTEAVERARGILDELGAELPPGQAADVAEQVGIGAVKYADLSTARDSAYVFDFNRMISFRGNTGPYLQYATARIRYLLANLYYHDSASASPVTISAPAERALVLRLLGFGAAVTAVTDTLEPHRLCGYLYELASDFTSFYEQCPVLKAESERLRGSRLVLCGLTLRVLTRGLDLLGVPVPEQM